MKVHWTKNAIGHLANISEYIGLNSPTYAKRTVDKMLTWCRFKRKGGGIWIVDFLLIIDDCISHPNTMVPTYPRGIGYAFHPGTGCPTGPR